VWGDYKEKTLELVRSFG